MLFLSKGQHAFFIWERLGGYSGGVKTVILQGENFGKRMIITIFVTK